GGVEILLSRGEDWCKVWGGCVPGGGFAQLIGNDAVGSKVFLAPDRKFIPGKVAYPATGLLNNQGARRSIPRAKLQLPESVDSTASHVAEIQGRRAVASDALGVSHKRLEKAQIEICFFTLVVGEASGEKCLVQLLHARYPDGCAV